MLTQRSIIARRISNSLPNTERTFRQCYSRNYSKLSFISTEQKSMTSTPTEAPTVAPETQKLQENSQITTCSHVHHEIYRIDGFHSGVYNASPQPKSAKKLSNADLEMKKIVAEHTCPIKTYNHAYYKEFSIAGFNPIRTSPPTQPEPANQMANKAAEETGKGFTNNPMGGASSTGSEISRDKALAIVTAYVPSFSLRKTKKNQDFFDLNHDMETCAQTIEELGFETLGIIGFQSTYDEMGKEEISSEVDDGKVDE